MTLDDIIKNWVRWHLRGMHRHRRQCASLEGNWRSKQYYDAPPITPLGPVDELLAQDTESAWRTLPTFDKFLLKWHHVFTRTPGAICKSMRQHGLPLAVRDYDFAVMCAEGHLSEALAKKKKCQDNRANAVVCAMSPPREGDVPTEAREAA